MTEIKIICTTEDERNRTYIGNLTEIEINGQTVWKVEEPKKKKKWQKLKNEGWSDIIVDPFVGYIEVETFDYNNFRIFKEKIGDRFAVFREVEE